MCKTNTIRETIRTTKIYASPTLKSEYGPELWNDTRKAAFGRLRLVNDPSALPVDVFHAELVEMDPSSFTDGLFCLSDMVEEMLGYMLATSREDDRAEEFAYRLERMTAERDALREQLKQLRVADVQTAAEPVHADYKTMYAAAAETLDLAHREVRELREKVRQLEEAGVQPQAEGPKENPQTDADYAVRVQAAAKQLPGVSVTVKGGCYVWVSGDTKPVKEQLKALGCRWSVKRSAWYWSPSCKRVSA